MVDSSAALAALEKSRFSSVDYSDSVRHQIAYRLVAIDPDEAAQVVATMKSPVTKCGGYLMVFNALGKRQPDRRAALLNDWIVVARSLGDPAQRAAALAQVAEKLAGIGQIGQAIKLLHESQGIADGLLESPFRNAIRGALAAGWALIDPGQSVRLVESADPFHCGMVAEKLAAKNPELAEKVFRMFPLGNGANTSMTRFYRLPRICYAMARTDLARAKKLAELANEAGQESRRYDTRPKGAAAVKNASGPLLKAILYAVMAFAVAESSQIEAQQLLEVQLTLLTPLREAVVHGPHDNYVFTPALVLAATLPIAERVDANLVPELLWRSISLRLPAEAGDPPVRRIHDSTIVGLAGMVARYDRAMARVLFEPVARRDAERTYGGNFFGAWTHVIGFHIDPGCMLEWAGTTSPDPISATSVVPRAEIPAILFSQMVTDLNLRNPMIHYDGAWEMVLGMLRLPYLPQVEETFGP